MEWLGYIADVIGVFGAVFALGAWLQTRKIFQEQKLEAQRQEKLISVELVHGGQSEKLPVKLRRIEFTRSEILGRLGMLPMKEKGQRFSLAYLSTDKFLRRLNEIAESPDETILEIPCTKEELEQFTL